VKRQRANINRQTSNVNRQKAKGKYEKMKKDFTKTFSRKGVSRKGAKVREVIYPLPFAFCRLPSPVLRLTPHVGVSLRFAWVLKPTQP
jgi:hypothetical protein